MPASEMTGQPFRIAVVGGGPRGVSVLERLACRIPEQTEPVSGRPITVYLIDNVQVGAGRLWRTNQPRWLIMNTISTEVTMFSGHLDNLDRGMAKPGAGPTLAEWWHSVEPVGAAAHPYGPYAPRYIFGRYLSYVLGVVEDHLARRGVTLKRAHGTVTHLSGADPAAPYRLCLADGTVVRADRLVLATGQPRVRLGGLARKLADAARDCEALTYLPGDSAADIDLEKVLPGERVGIIGLGLGFYDILAALTIGRGGTFRDAGGGRMVYCPSGREPVIIAGSRSGVPFLARGRNQKPPDYRYQSRLLTKESMSGNDADTQLDFGGEVFPWIVAEVNLVYYETLARVRAGETGADEFRRSVATALSGDSTDPAGEIGKVAAAFGLRDEPCPDLAVLARPFSTRTFGSHAAFTAALRAYLERDLSQAVAGNVDDPLKAALETLRLIRPVIRNALEFGGVTPESYVSDFLDFFAPVESLLTAGPPLARMAELLALMDSGTIKVVGPQLRIRAEPDQERYVMWSPQVRDAPFVTRTIVDSRVPKTDIRADQDPLIRQLIHDGLIRTHVISNAHTHFDTGGVDITPRPFHPIRACGCPDPDMYILGLPTEGTRWYTQIGSGRPGYWNDFTRDADSVAADLMAALCERVGDERAGERRCVTCR